MSRHSFRYLDNSCSIKRLLAAFVICASTGLLTHADERPAKPAGSNVAKASASSEADKPSKEHVQQLIRDLGSPHYSVRRAAANELRQVGAEAFDLLAAIGRDCVGAIQLLPEDREPVGFDSVEGEPLTDAEVERAISEGMSNADATAVRSHHGWM